jgi:hypothetical protein
MATVIAVLASQAAPAQEWAKRMFKEHKHDFGTVARGAKVEYEFTFQNIFVEDIHIAGVRTSCGCTSPYIKDDKRTYKTWEEGSIVAKLNTKSFLGHKSASIIVTIDRPYYAEVQLSVSSQIRSDVVFTPGVVEFGTLEQGAGDEKSVTIDYAGRHDWEIVDVRSANPHFEVELTEKQRGGGRVAYQMLVRLKGDHPSGYINDQLTIVTNDDATKTIPLTVEGRVNSPLTVSPATFSLGQLEPGETVTKQLVVRGKSAFKITEIKCDGGNCFEFEKPDESKTLQIIPVTYTAGETPGKMVHTIHIDTDLSGASATCVATATVMSPSDGG